MYRVMSMPLVVGGEGTSWIEVLSRWPASGTELGCSSSEEERGIGSDSKLKFRIHQICITEPSGISTSDYDGSM
jgi:hypothetical protein